MPPRFAARSFARLLPSALLLFALGALPARAASDGPRIDEVGGQATGVLQGLLPFRSPYAGSSSLPSRYDTAISQTYTAFLGIRAWRSLDFYLDPEASLGTGVGGVQGVAGEPNGETVRVGGNSPNLAENIRVARAFARLNWPLSTATADVAPGENQIGGVLPADRLQVEVGKLSVVDVFDTNAYAGSARTQFLDWVLVNDGAYDYAADAHGYTWGTAAEWVHPDWTLRAGAFQMPVEANGEVLDPDLANSHGTQLEWQVQTPWAPASGPVVARVLGYANWARMGHYAAALATVGAGSVPDVKATRQPGTLKYGAAAGLEVPLADDGATGAFLRLGWNDGQTESFAFTEADRHLSVGAQLGGVRWGRPDDRAGLAVALDGLSPVHQAYLAAGGHGFLLGDGQLNYAPETVLEAYYAWKLGEFLALSLDGQVIANPGYNADRGPAALAAVRLHVER